MGTMTNQGIVSLLNAHDDIPFEEQCYQFWGYCPKSRGRHKCTQRVGHESPHACRHCKQALARGAARSAAGSRA